MRYIAIVALILLTYALIGCSTDDSNPYIPQNLPTEEELDHLYGNWQGTSTTISGSFELIDKIYIQFYEYNNHVNATFYLNDTYVDEVYVDYDGDLIWFSSSNIFGDYGEFSGQIDHYNLEINGTFFYQSGIDYKDGTFEIMKL